MLLIWIWRTFALADFTVHILQNAQGNNATPDKRPVIQKADNIAHGSAQLYDISKA